MMSDSSRHADALAVFYDEQHVGYLHNQEPLAFSYAPEWLQRPTAYPIHAAIGLQSEKINTPQVHAFFENLLPEGEQRRLIGLQCHASSVFGLLAAVGGDTAGALVLLPLGQQPQKPAHEKLSWAQIDKLIHFSAMPTEGDTLDEGDPEKFRMSISGAQFKLLLSLDADGQPLRPLGTTPSTHILKPDIARAGIAVFASALNEALVMRAAALCGLPTAKVNYQLQVRACLVERFDRVYAPNGGLRRLWQADFCQLSGRPSTSKYEADGGPAFKECFDIVKSHSSRPALDQKNLLRWLFYNLYVGNNDSHAKNISMLADGDGLHLAPFYDLMCTRVYSGLSPRFSFQIGGETMPGKLQTRHLEQFAASLGIAPKYLRTIAADMARKVAAAIPKAAQDLAPGLGPAEKVIALRIEQKIAAIIKQTCNRLLDEKT